MICCHYKPMCLLIIYWLFQLKNKIFALKNMQTSSKFVGSQLSDIISSLHQDKKYELENGSFIYAFEINSLTYINLEAFLKVVEKVMGVTMPNKCSTIFAWLINQIYVENLTHFSPIKYAVCTNFLEEKLLVNVKNVILENGGAEKNQENSKSEEFELTDVDLYKKILDDDNYLYKQMCKKSKCADLSTKTSNDLYDAILNNSKNSYFTANDLQKMRKSDIFSTETNFNEMFDVCNYYKNQYSENFQMTNNQQNGPKDINDFQIHQKNMIARGLLKPFSKPRGKQMEHVDKTDRPFLCKVPGCNRAFKRFEHLKRHNKMHTGEKPFVCKFPGCSRSFSRSDNLNAHYKTHNISQQQIDELNNKHKATHHINFDSF